MLLLLDEAMSAGTRHLVVGLNPAYQKIITLPSLVASSVNRASASIDAVGGKGQNVILASSCIGVHPLLAQFLGGGEGAKVSDMLFNINANCAQFTVSSSARTRTCITLIDERSREATEIIEPSGAISAAEAGKMLTLLSEAFAATKVGIVTIMGSAPPGIGNQYYGDIVSTCVGPGSRVVIDSLFGVLEVVEACKAVGADLCIKVNARELLKLADYSPAAGTVSEKETDRSIDEGSILTALAALRVKYSLGSSSDAFVCLTDGPFSAYLLPLSSRMGGGDESYFKYTLPPLPRGLVNPIGAGDSVAAGLSAVLSGAYALRGAGGAGVGADAAFRFGLACGMASCLTTVNAELRGEDATALFSQIRVEERPLLL